MRNRRVDCTALLLAAVCLFAVCFAFSPKRPEESRLATVSTEGTKGVLVRNGRTLIDINAANADLFLSLPGIGETLAGRIVAYRDENGSFSSVDELDNVPGIGEKTIEALREYVAAP